MKLRHDIGIVALLSAALLSCRAGGGVHEGELAALDRQRVAIEAALDDWHDAASKADGARYFGHMTSDAVFLGTDASERWTLAEFRAYAEPFFAQGRGWTYTPRERHVFLAPGGIAWFDERLWNEKYGECRGTGVLREERGEWRIAHYNLAFPIPNEVVPELLRLTRGR